MGPQPKDGAQREFIFQSRRVRSRGRRRFFSMSARRTSSNVSSILLSLLTISFGTSSTRFSFTFHISLCWSLHWQPCFPAWEGVKQPLSTNPQRLAGGAKQSIWKTFFCSLCPLTKTGGRNINCLKTSLQAPSQSAGPNFYEFLIFCNFLLCRELNLCLNTTEHHYKLLELEMRR